MQKTPIFEIIVQKSTVNVYLHLNIGKQFVKGYCIKARNMV